MSVATVAALAGRTVTSFNGLAHPSASSYNSHKRGLSAPSTLGIISLEGRSPDHKLCMNSRSSWIGVRGLYSHNSAMYRCDAALYHQGGTGVEFSAHLSLRAGRDILSLYAAEQHEEDTGRKRGANLLSAGPKWGAHHNANPTLARSLNPVKPAPRAAAGASAGIQNCAPYDGFVLSWFKIGNYGPDCLGYDGCC
jgi:hypothetical protein